MNHRIYRQGDVLLVEIKAVPAGAKLRRRKRQVLALGEATGHHHTITAERMEVAEVSAEEVYLRIMGAPAQLVHQEHATITVEPGTYRRVIQREYAAGELRRVLD